MSTVIEKKSTKDMLDQGHNFALVGLIICLFAFSLSVLSPWIIDEFAPPPPKIEDIVVDKAVSLRDRLVEVITFSEKEVAEKKEDAAQGDLKIKRSIKPAETEGKKSATHWTDYLTPIIIVISLGGIINAAVGLMKQEYRFVACAAIFFGISAIIAQYMMIALAVLVFVLLIAALMSSLGIGG